MAHYHSQQSLPPVDTTSGNIASSGPDQTNVQPFTQLGKNLTVGDLLNSLDSSTRKLSVIHAKQTTTPRGSSVQEKREFKSHEHLHATVARKVKSPQRRRLLSCEAPTDPRSSISLSGTSAAYISPGYRTSRKTNYSSRQATSRNSHRALALTARSYREQCDFPNKDHSSRKEALSTSQTSIVDLKQPIWQKLVKRTSQTVADKQSLQSSTNLTEQTLPKLLERTLNYSHPAFHDVAPSSPSSPLSKKQSRLVKEDTIPSISSPVEKFEKSLALGEEERFEVTRYVRSLSPLVRKRQGQLSPLKKCTSQEMAERFTSFQDDAPKKDVCPAPVELSVRQLITPKPQMTDNFDVPAPPNSGRTSSVDSPRTSLSSNDSPRFTSFFKAKMKEDREAQLTKGINVKRGKSLQERYDVRAQRLTNRSHDNKLDRRSSSLRKATIYFSGSEEVRKSTGLVPKLYRSPHLEKSRYSSRSRFRNEQVMDILHGSDFYKNQQRNPKLQPVDDENEMFKKWLDLTQNTYRRSHFPVDKHSYVSDKLDIPYSVIDDYKSAQSAATEVVSEILEEIPTDKQDKTHHQVQVTVPCTKSDNCLFPSDGTVNVEKKNPRLSAGGRSHTSNASLTSLSGRATGCPSIASEPSVSQMLDEDNETFNNNEENDYDNSTENEPRDNTESKSSDSEENKNNHGTRKVPCRKSLSETHSLFFNNLSLDNVCVVKSLSLTNLVDKSSTDTQRDSFLSQFTDSGQFFKSRSFSANGEHVQSDSKMLERPQDTIVEGKTISQGNNAELLNRHAPNSANLGDNSGTSCSTSHCSTARQSLSADPDAEASCCSDEESDEATDRDEVTSPAFPDSESAYEGSSSDEEIVPESIASMRPTLDSESVRSSVSSPRKNTRSGIDSAGEQSAAETEGSVEMTHVTKVQVTIRERPKSRTSGPVGDDAVQSDSDMSSKAGVTILLNQPEEQEDGNSTVNTKPAVVQDKKKRKLLKCNQQEDKAFPPLLILNNTIDDQQMDVKGVSKKSVRFKNSESRQRVVKVESEKEGILHRSRTGNLSESQPVSKITASFAFGVTSENKLDSSEKSHLFRKNKERKKSEASVYASQQFKSTFERRKIKRSKPEVDSLECVHNTSFRSYVYSGRPSTAPTPGEESIIKGFKENSKTPQPEETLSLDGHALPSLMGPRESELKCIMPSSRAASDSEFELTRPGIETADKATNTRPLSVTNAEDGVPVDVTAMIEEETNTNRTDSALSKQKEIKPRKKILKKVKKIEEESSSPLPLNDYIENGRNEKVQSTESFPQPEIIKRKKSASWKFSPSVKSSTRYSRRSMEFYLKGGLYSPGFMVTPKYFVNPLLRGGTGKPSNSPFTPFYVPGGEKTKRTPDLCLEACVVMGKGLSSKDFL